MEDNKLAKKKIFFISLMLLFFGVLIEVLFALFGNTYEKYTDVVIENLAIVGGNKTFERNMVYGLCFAGIAVYALFDFINRRKLPKDQFIADKNGKNEAGQTLFLVGILSIFFVNTAIYNEINVILSVQLLLVFASYILKKSFTVQTFSVFFISLYAILAVYRIINSLVIASAHIYIKSNTIIFLLVVLIAGIITLFSLFIKKKEIVNRYILVSQLFIPFNIGIILNDEYLYGQQLVKISNPIQTVILVWTIIIALVCVAVRLLFKRWKDSDCDINDVFSFGTFISILFVNRFNGTGAIISTDLHHPYENIIGFFQIFEKSQKIFEDYIPISGLYSVLHGAFFKLLGNGEASFYFISDNFYYLIVLGLIVLLLKNRISNTNLLFISLTFVAVDYDRIVFILPIMLLLSHPALIKRKAYWFVVYFITSLFHGLYYPLYGAAVAVAFFPLAIKQACNYVKQREYKTDFKSKKILLCIAFCILLFVLSISALLGMFKHISILSSQTVMADGLTRFGQMVPEYFLKICDNEGIRLVIYYLLSFLPLIAVVWLGFIMFLETKNYLYLAVSIVPAISYSSTLVRIDFDSLYARGNGSIFAACFLLLILLLNTDINKKITQYIFALAVVIVAFSGEIGFLSVPDKLDIVYEVPDNYQYVVNDVVEKYGTGFVESSMYEEVYYYHEKFKDLKEITFLGDPIMFGHFYLAEATGVGTMEIVNIPKGYEAAKETIEAAKNNGSFIGGNFCKYDTYYIYKYLMTSGEYVWSENYGDFVPNVNNLSLDEVYSINRTANVAEDNYSFGDISANLGNSFESFENIFSNIDTNFEIETAEGGLHIEFPDLIDGNEVDFIYFDFQVSNNIYDYYLFDTAGFYKQDNVGIFKDFYGKMSNHNTYVSIGWQDENNESRAIYSCLKDGKLLVPMGAINTWLLNEHSAIDIKFFGEIPENFALSLSDIKFLKIRELK